MFNKDMKHLRRLKLRIKAYNLVDNSIPHTGLTPIINRQYDNLKFLRLSNYLF